MSERPQVPDIIRSTVDLADQDRATGHLTTFWHQRVLALCELLGGAVAAGAGDRPPAPSDAAQKLADAIINEFGAVGLDPDHEDYTHEDYLIGLALEVRAVRPPPRAAPPEERK